MEENLRTILYYLFLSIKETQEGAQILDMVLTPDKKFVVADYKGGIRKVIRLSGENGWSMIKEVVAKLDSNEPGRG